MKQRFRVLVLTEDTTGITYKRQEFDTRDEALSYLDSFEKLEWGAIYESFYKEEK